jgi:hypothetical protein
MTFPADQPVVSGQSYTVTAVDGHRPAALTDFVGTIAVTLVRDGHRHRLIGDGAATSGTIRFHEKDPGPDDKDIRVWTITARGGGTFLAETGGGTFLAETAAAV